VDAAIAAIVNDPWLCRRLHRLVAAAGFVPGELHSHGYAAEATPAYLFSLVDYGADALAAAGGVSPATADALKAEARHRVDSGDFFGHISYLSLLASRI
jgi:arsenite methyltransferase